MSSEGRAPASALELTRRAFASANERDYDAMMIFYGAGSVWDVSRWGLGTHTGPAAIRRFFEDWMGSFESYRVEVEAMRDLGEGVVYVVAVQYAHSAGSDGYLQLRYAPVFLWEDGMAVRVTHYRDLVEGRSAGEQLAVARHAEARHDRLAAG